MSIFLLLKIIMVMTWPLPIHKGNTHINITSKSFHDYIISLVQIIINNFHDKVISLHN